MSFATASSLLLSIVARKYDLEAEDMRLKYEKMSLMATQGALEAQMHGNPHASMAQALQAQLAALKTTEKLLDMRIAHIEHEKEGLENYEQKVEKRAQEGAKVFGKGA
ncbi:MAG: hypothetical protein U0003_05490 [Vampirovibrionales bacterium]